MDCTWYLNGLKNLPSQSTSIGLLPSYLYVLQNTIITNCVWTINTSIRAAYFAGTNLKRVYQYLRMSILDVQTIYTFGFFSHTIPQTDIVIRGTASKTINNSNFTIIFAFLIQIWYTEKSLQDLPNCVLKVDRPSRGLQMSSNHFCPN